MPNARDVWFALLVIAFWEFLRFVGRCRVKGNPEPQEGAQQKHLSSEADTSVQSGVPSCDSELAVCRRQVADRCADWATAETLLRMVEELTVSLRDEKQGAEQWVDRCRAALKERDFQATRASDAQAILSAVSKERDDLRAKLAETERDRDGWKAYATDWNTEAMRSRAQKKELEAKLAEAEKRYAALAGENVADHFLGSDLEHAVKRAEAAEARCRYLESKLGRSITAEEAICSYETREGRPCPNHRKVR